MRMRLGLLWGAVLLGALASAPAFSIPVDCTPIRTLWTPVGIYRDSGLGLSYRAESREYRCVYGEDRERVEVRVEDSRAVYLGLPEGVWLFRYPGDTVVLFVREGVGEEGRTFAESLLEAGRVDLLLVHEGVRLSPEAVRRARMVMRLKPGGHALSLGDARFPLYRLETILDELDAGLRFSER